MGLEPFNAIQINYDQANELSDLAYDIGVFEASSGCFFNFDAKWRYRGLKRYRDDILQELGTGGMDDHYVFFWIKAA